MRKIEGKSVKKIALLITLTTLLASQAFGAALCPSVCESLKSQTSESASAGCHQEMPTEEMPADCSVMAMLETLSTFNVSSNALEGTKFDFEKTLFKATEESQFATLAFADPSLLVIGKSPPFKQRPIYILIQSFLI